MALRFYIFGDMAAAAVAARAMNAHYMAQAREVVPAGARDNTERAVAVVQLGTGQWAIAESELAGSLAQEIKLELPPATDPPKETYMHAARGEVTETRITSVDFAASDSAR